MTKFDKSNLDCVYRFSGDDMLLIKQNVKELEEACNVSMPEINKTIFDSDNFNVEKVLLACEQLPVMSDKRLVHLKNIIKLKDGEIEKLVLYAKNPAMDTVLILEEVTGGNAFGKVPATKIVCNKLSEDKLKPIVIKELEEVGKTIDQEALNLLLDFCSNDSYRINNELLKLKYITEKDITCEIIKSMVHKNDEFSVFEISTALTYGQGDKAINLIHKMLESMEFPVILGLISAHFRRMLYAVISNGTNDEIAEKLGVKPFAISKAKSLAKNLSPKQILDICSLILDIDYNIKNGTMNVENSLYYLVFSVIAIVKGEKNV